MLGNIFFCCRSATDVIVKPMLFVTLNIETGSRVKWSFHDRMKAGKGGTNLVGINQVIIDRK